MTSRADRAQGCIEVSGRALLSIDATAERCGVDGSTAREWIQKGWLTPILYGKQRRLDKEEVETFVANGNRTPHKKCTRCGQDFPRAEFLASTVTGRSRALCRECHKARNLEFRRSEKERVGKVHVTRAEQAKKRVEQEEQKKTEIQLRATITHAVKVERARVLLAREAAEKQRAAEAAKKLMPHARAIDDELLRFVKRDAFWARARRIDDGDGCWEWSGQRKETGYGNVDIYMNGKCIHVLAHRLAWALMNGCVPKGLCVLHHCDNPPCIRPDHLFLGKPADNNADMIAKGREAFPAGTTPPHLAQFIMTNGVVVPGSPAAINMAKTCCPKCGGPLTMSSHGSQGSRRRCLPCSKSYNAEHRAEWQRRCAAKKLLTISNEQVGAGGRGSP